MSKPDTAAILQNGDTAVSIILAVSMLVGAVFSGVATLILAQKMKG
ncbi:hypothetical protein K9N68_05995 [Kovacikia minuta CCNUW1]|nr:hypothetical protein [Kovacikia minuta]UBF27492.1 hypothetical protein K9N68_05995 [Kovacikia minuta CCNUW1]